MQNIEYAIENSRHGEPTLCVYKQNGDKIYLHSKYDPLKEAQAFRERFDQDKFDFLIILGAGLGYHMIPLIGLKHKYKEIVVIDIIKDIDKEIEKNKCTNPLISSGNIIFLTGMDLNELEQKINTLLDFDKIKGIDVIEHAPSIRAFPEYYKQSREIIGRSIDKKAGNKATHKAFAMLYLRNIIKNFNPFRYMIPVSAFFNKMKNFPCLVITSGPSLEDYAEKISYHQNNFFIITVDSALKTLSAYGVEPDFFVSIDPQPFIFEHIFGINTDKPIPVFTVSTHTLMIQQCSNTRGILSLNSHPISQVIDDIFPGVTGSVDSGTGTVAGDAVEISQKMGFGNTGLVGFDFSFPDFKIYPRETAYQKRFKNTTNRFNTAETINFNYIMKSSKGIKYENKFTRKSFLLYREYMENLLKNYESGIYNINNKGISFGIPYMNPETFFNNYCKEKINKKEIIDDILKRTRSLGDLIDFEIIKRTLSNEAMFTEFIDASLGNDRDRKTDTIKSLFNDLI